MYVQVITKLISLKLIKRERDGGTQEAYDCVDVIGHC
jgi:hypothetical protein